MKQLIPVFVLCLLVSCSGHGSASGGATGGATSSPSSNGNASGSATSAQAQNAAADPSKLIDTEKLKQDIGNVMRSMDAQHPVDTNALKAAASDILTTDATVLSDSGIDQLGDKNDPAAKAAQDALKKMRNSMGLTPAMLDSIRKAGAGGPKK